MGSRTAVTVALVAALTLPGSLAFADPNHPEPQVPTSCARHEPSRSSGSSGSPARSRSTGTSVAGEIVGAILSGIFSGGSSESSEPEAEPVASAAPGDPGWAISPDTLGLRLEGGVGSLDFGPSEFVDDESSVHMLGSALRIGRSELVGAELAVDVAPVPWFRASVGGGFFGPVGGDDGSYWSRRSSSDGIRLVSAFVEAGFYRRVGVLDGFALLHAGLLAVDISVDDTCGCTRNYRALRFTVGPRVGVRTHLTGALFVQASVFMDAAQFPDYVASLGIGLGRRAL